jgi:hypothetical protein
MTYHTACLLLTAIGAALSGPIEASWTRYRIRTGNPAKLPHDLLTLVRVVVGGGLLIGLGFEQRIPVEVVTVTLVACMAAFAMVHRVSFNLAHGQDFEYMGPKLRRDDDSAYDTLWHSVAAKVTMYYDHGINKGKTFYQPRFEGSPFVFAVIFELVVCAACVVAVEMMR